jgi:Spy/CpxP family protein refolding chaperone
MLTQSGGILALRQIARRAGADESCKYRLLYKSLLRRKALETAHVHHLGQGLTSARSFMERAMTDESKSQLPTPPADDRPQRCRGRGRTAFFALLIALGAGLAGVYAANAFGGYGFGHHGGWHGRGMWGQMDPAQIEDRADRMVRHLAVEVDASTDQQEKLRALVKATVKDLLPMRDKAQAARLRGRELLTQPNLDRAAIEAFRTEQMALADAFSRRLAQTLADAAAILTPEQRRKIAELLPPRPPFWRGWHRG